MNRLVLFLITILFVAAPASAQSIPPPTAPVVFCGVQAAPEASSYQLIFDGGDPEPLTMDATINPACTEGTTHSFQVAAVRFVVGKHTLVVRATNTFGSTDGPVYEVVVGIAPGQFEIKAVLAPKAGGA